MQAAASSALAGEWDRSGRPVRPGLWRGLDDEAQGGAGEGRARALEALRVCMLSDVSGFDLENEAQNRLCQFG